MISLAADHGDRGYAIGSAVFGSHEEMSRQGFEGFRTISELDADRKLMPTERGVYLVSRVNSESPEFVLPGTGGFFKGRDPNIDIEVLRENWVPDTITIYIGKAGSPAGKATLRSRLSEYWSFGRGKNIGHWGGRYIWQLADARELVVCWKQTPDDDPRTVEAELISRFVATYGRLPFANLKT